MDAWNDSYATALKTFLDNITQMKLSILIIDYAVSIDKPYLFAGRLLRQGGDNSLKAAVV